MRWESASFPRRWGTVTEEDLRCLDPGELLTDKIINFYLNHLLDSGFSKSANATLFIFSTYFYNKMKMMKPEMETKVCHLRLCATCVSASRRLCRKYNRVRP